MRSRKRSAGFWMCVVPAVLVGSFLSVVLGRQLLASSESGADLAALSDGVPITDDAPVQLQELASKMPPLEASNRSSE